MIKYNIIHASWFKYHINNNNKKKIPEGSLFSELTKPNLNFNAG